MIILVGAINVDWQLILFKYADCPAVPCVFHIPAELDKDPQITGPAALLVAVTLDDLILDKELCGEYDTLAEELTDALAE